MKQQKLPAAKPVRFTVRKLMFAPTWTIEDNAYSPARALAYCRHEHDAQSVCEALNSCDVVMMVPH